MPEFKDKKAHIRYGLEWIISGFYQILIVFMLSILFGVVKEALTCLIVGAVYRSFAGGVHFSKYSICLISGTFQIMLISILATKMNVDEKEILLFLIISFVWGTIMTYINAPRLGKKKKLFTQKKMVTYRTISLLFFSVVLLVGLVVGFQNPIFISAWFALLFQIFTLTSLSKNMINKLEKIMNIKGI